MLVGLSYGLPLIVSLLTVIVEFGYNENTKCASYRPRFGEETCFFSGNVFKNMVISTSSKINFYLENWLFSFYYIERTSKGIWFFVPMALALMVNTGIFISITVTLYKVYGNMQQFKLKNKEGDIADK